METRRRFLRQTILGVGVALLPGLGAFKKAFASFKRVVLPKGTDAGSLKTKYPAALDTRNLTVTPLKYFGTMGETEVLVNLDNWRLSIGGKVEKPVSMTFEEVKSLTPYSKDVLLICPGFFSQHGRWKGLALESLFEITGLDPTAEWIEFEGEREGMTNSKKSYSVREAREKKVFLAYEVNDQPLPIKHGYPLRIVAEDHFGGDWVKYVHKITVK